MWGHSRLHHDDDTRAAQPLASGELLPHPYPCPGLFGRSRRRYDREVLVGRAAERERIDALLALARDGSGGALVLRGEPGIGKSALLRYAQERADGMRVLFAHGVEAEAELAFSGLYELLRPVLGLLDEIPERQADALRGAFGLGPPLDRSLLIGAGTLSLLATAAEAQPLVCLVDDANWLDAASSDALLFLARRLEADSIAMLFAARDGDPRTFEPPGIEELVVFGLERAEAAELLRGSGLPDRVVTELHRAATGNPLALLELPGALTERQRAGQEPLPEPLPVTKAIQASYQRRIRALPESTRRALIVAAAEPSGRLALIEGACAAMEIDPAALAAAEDAELLDIVDARVVFRHPLALSVAYHAGKPTERRLIHAALADAVRGEDASRHAWHTAEAAAGPSEDVAATLEAAARGAFARSGYRSAATTLERAAALTPDSARRAQRLYFAAIMHFYSHGIARALTLLDQAEGLVPGGEDEARFRLLRLALWYYRDSQRAATLLLEEAERLDARPPDAAFAAALAACFRSFVRDAAGSLEAAERTRHYAGRSDADDPIAGVGAGNGFVAAGRPGEAGPLRAGSGSDGREPPGQRARLQNHQGGRDRGQCRGHADAGDRDRIRVEEGTDSRVIETRAALGECHCVEERGRSSTDDHRRQTPGENQLRTDPSALLGRSKVASQPGHEWQEEEHERDIGQVVADEVPRAVVGEELSRLGDRFVVRGRLALENDASDGKEQEPTEAADAGKARPTPGSTRAKGVRLHLLIPHERSFDVWSHAHLAGSPEV
jgi:AAA ATPase domain